MKQFRNHLFLAACLGFMSMGLHGMEIDNGSSSKGPSIEEQLETGIPSEESIRTYKQTQRIHEIFLKLIKPKERATCALNIDEYGEQTNSGFFLEYISCVPLNLLTPWGTVHLWPDPPSHNSDTHTKSMKQVGKKLLSQLETSVYQKGSLSESFGRYTTLGPVYSILKLDGEELPSPDKPGFCAPYPVKPHMVAEIFTLTQACVESQKEYATLPNSSHGEVS